MNKMNNTITSPPPQSNLTKSLLLKNIAGHCSYARTVLGCAKGRSQRERTADHAVLHGFRPHALYSHKLGMSSAWIHSLGKVHPRTLWIFISFILQERNYKNVWPESGRCLEWIIRFSIFLFVCASPTAAPDQAGLVEALNRLSQRLEAIENRIIPGQI